MDKRVHHYVIPEHTQSHHTFVIDDTSNAQHHHICLYVERNAQLVIEILVVCSAQVIIECILQGEGAHARIAGVYAIGLAEKVHIETIQHHKAANTHSALVMRGILRDHAQMQYHGKIRVEKDASHSVSSQENKNILLSNSARAVSVPSLEILNNDVQCAHGSATSRCDSEQLFYCASRGIDENISQRLLLQAFVADVFVSDELNAQMRMLIE